MAVVDLILSLSKDEVVPRDNLAKTKARHKAGLFEIGWDELRCPGP
jgi:hypothetical protein